MSDQLYEGATIRVRFREAGRTVVLVGLVVSVATDAIGVRPWGCDRVLSLPRAAIKRAAVVGGAGLLAARPGIEQAQARALARIAPLDASGEGTAS